MARIGYSKGLDEFYEPRKLSYQDFRWDNGFVRTAYDNFVPNQYEPCSQVSKKWFRPAITLNCFPLHNHNDRGRESKDIRFLAKKVWSIYGFRTVIEFFDTNVLMEVQNKLYDAGYDRDDAIKKIVDDLRKDELILVDIIGDRGFINVRLKESVA